MELYQFKNLSYSALGKFKEDPWIFWCTYLAPEEIRLKMQKTTKTLEFGIGLHTYIFEPQIFNDKFIVADVDMRTKEGKRIKEEITSTGKKLIKPEEFDKIKDMQESIYSNTIITNFLNNGKAEEKLYCTIEDELFSAKMDYLVEPCAMFPSGLIVDLKTTTSVEADDISKTQYKYGYYMQMYIYQEAYRQKYGCKPFYLYIYVEQAYPHRVRVPTCSEFTEQYAMKEVHKLVREYKEIKKSGVWKKQARIEVIDLPMWVKEIK